jgi:hypothetical protein
MKRLHVKLVLALQFDKAHRQPGRRLRDQRTQKLALRVDCAPQIDHAPIDFQINLIKMPDRVRLETAFPQLRCNNRSEMIHPTSDFSYETAIPRSASESSTSRKLSVNRR